MKNIKVTLEKRGYVATDLGGGDHAMIKQFPYGLTVWVYDEQSNVTFAASSKNVHVGVYENGVPMDHREEVLREKLPLAIQRMEVLAYQEGTARLNEDDLVEEAFNEAISVIQEKLGVKDGGFAGLHFSGELGEQMKTLLSDYLNAELQFNEPEPVETWVVKLILEDKAEFNWTGEADDEDHAQGLAIADAVAETGQQVLEVVSTSVVE